MKKITACPGWLTLSPDRTSFILSPERAKLVRTIFAWSIAGLGAYTIAKRLDAMNAPTFGSSKKWDPSTITNLLRNRATLGTFYPKKKLDGKVRSSGEPVRDYYPSVIDETIFAAAREASCKNLTSGRGRKGHRLTNLFAGIATCYYCDAPIKFHSNGNSKSLICSTVLERKGCQRTAWSYDDFEETFLLLGEQNRMANLDDLFERMRSSVPNNDDLQIRELRLDLAIVLRENVVRLALASSGRVTGSQSESRLIRRNRPERFFELQFVGGNLQTAYPPTRKREFGPKLEQRALTNAFGLSTRQAEITILLVEGLSLAQSAVQLGMGVETARWHLRETFRRTKTHSQPELILCAISAAQSR